MIRRILLGVAMLAALFAVPARTQVVGEWRFELSDGSVASMRVTRDRSTPSRMSAIGDLNGHLIVFEGEFVNLQWRGKWYWFADPGQSLPGLPVCTEAVRPPASHVSSGSTRHTGAFEFRFNAGENRIDGSWKSACPYRDGRVRTSPPVTFVATRMNTITQRVATVPIGGTPGAASSAPPPAMSGLTGDDTPCTQVAVFKISGSGSLGVPDTVFSDRYRLRPCLITAGSKIQVDLLNPEGKRPIRLRFEALRINSLENIGLRQRYTAIPMAAVHQQGLPFVGEPRAGQVIGNIPVAGRLCAAPLWLVWLDFSDGTRSAQPIGTLFSLCGIKLHPELVPPELRPRGSDRESPRPAGDLRPAGG